jgi:Tfp pilus assembly protein PilV
LRLLRRISDERGFTLASVVIAAAVLAVAAFILGGLIARSLQDQQASEEGFRAVFLAQEKAEELKSLPFDQVASEPEADVPGCPGFRQSVTVEELNPYTKRVTVRVVYPVRGGSGRTGVQELVFERTVDF